ncbi:G1/S-specific cyclin-D2 [Melipona quadrifasciata]|uniref:G1/S-specific cyclin-D2 n=1 Tax=Melipona quadrifasciata TaxID=166423 RepID=A0A0M8ZV38_9HYME|nr:G1/S-specific cyclin-D2 [Melipona quadrifasciata]
MDLLCCETTAIECRAYPDPVLLDDDRVLQNLLKTEERYSPSTSYFECVQTEISAPMRKIVAEWMLESGPRVALEFPEKFFIAQPIVIACNNQKRPRGRNVNEKQTGTILIGRLMMVRWEQLVVSKLKWELSAVTPGDFLMHILSRLPVPRTWDPVMVRRHAQTFIALSARGISNSAVLDLDSSYLGILDNRFEYKFSIYTPSMIAAASVAAALHGLDWTGKSGYGLAGLLDELTRITAIEQDYLQGCLEQIEEMVSQAMNTERIGGPERHSVSIPSATQRPLGDEITSQEKILEHEKASTPTDVRDVHF